MTLHVVRSTLKRNADTFGGRMREARQAAGLSQQELANIVGIKQPSIQAIECGRVKGTKHVVAIARATGRSPEWLAMGMESGDAEESSSSGTEASLFDGGVLVAINGADYARIGVYETRRLQSPTQPIDYHLVSLRSLRLLSQVPVSQIVGFQLESDAMWPTIGPMDWMFVDISHRDLSGPGIYVLDARGEISIHRFSGAVGGGPVNLMCDNPKYSPLHVEDPLRIRFIGKALFTVVRC